jgi:hypothetical protein
MAIEFLELLGQPQYSLTIITSENLKGPIDLFMREMT